ncbi:MAG: MarR family winged helix-turn-helix transcriptional regulator [Rhodocyclaceae bacterium]
MIEALSGTLPGDVDRMTLSMSLAVLRRAYRSAADKAVAHLGLSQALAYPVVMLGRLGDGVRQGAVAHVLAIDDSSLVRLVDQLVEDGLVERREDRTDRRARSLFLTERGHAMAAQVEAALAALRDRLYADIADADIRACLKVFAVLEQRLGCATPDISHLGARIAPEGGATAP